MVFKTRVRLPPSPRSKKLNMIVRIVKTEHKKKLINYLLSLGYKYDEIHSLTNRANYIYLHEGVFEVCNKFKWQELKDNGVEDFGVNVEQFKNKINEKSRRRRTN